MKAQFKKGPNGESVIIKYQRARNSYLLENKVPILFLERFEKSEASSLYQKRNNNSKLKNEALSHLLNNNVDIDLFLENFWQYLQSGIDIKVTRRDQEMARNLNSIEQLLSNHPHGTFERDPHIIAEIGAGHYLEDYINREVNVIDISCKENKGLTRTLYEGIRTGASFESMKTKILQMGLENLALILPIDLSVFDENIDYETLRDKTLQILSNYKS